MKKNRYVLASNASLLAYSYVEYLLRTYNSVAGVSYYMSFDDFPVKSYNDYVIKFDDFAGKCIAGIRGVPDFFAIACMI